jgi:hypothetical protein
MANAYNDGQSVVNPVPSEHTQSSNGGGGEGGYYEDLCWWECPEGDAHKNCERAVRTIMDEQRQLYAADKLFLSVYMNRDSTSVSSLWSAHNLGDRISVNVIKAAIDTAVAQIGSSRNRPQYLTVGGDYPKRKRAKDLTDFIVGVFNKAKVYIKAHDVFRDALIFGSGFFKVIVDGKNISIRLVSPLDLVVDEIEARHGTPRAYADRSTVSKASLIAQYPELEEEIKQARVIEWEGEAPEGYTDMVTVLDCYHTAADDDPGRHVICLDTCTLLDEPYHHEDAPYVKFDWHTAIHGYRGQGGVEEALPIQKELIYLAQKTQEHMTLSAGRWFAKKGSQIGEISNTAMEIIECVEPPTYQAPPSISGEWLNQQDRLQSLIFNLMGVSQMQAQSVKPAGLDSGAAIRAYSDIATQRFKHTEQRWADFFVSLGDAVIRACDEAGDVTIITKNGTSNRKLTWADVKMDQEDYLVQVYPMNALPDEPASKLQQVAELTQQNPALAPYVLSLMTDVPDLEAVVSRVNASRNIVEKLLGLILEHGKYEPPFSEMDLKLAKQITVETIVQAQVDDVDEDRIALLRQFNQQIDDLLAPPPPPPMPMGMEGMGPMGPEMGMPPMGPEGPMGGGMPPLPPDMGGGMPPEQMGGPPPGMPPGPSMPPM